MAAACRLAGDLVIGGSPSESAIQGAAETDAEMRDYLEHAWNDLSVERRARAVVLALLERGVQATLAPTA